MKTDYKPLIYAGAGALGGAVAVASIYLGANPVDAATAVSGGVGIAAGVVAGSVASSMLSPQIPLVGYQFLGAAAIAGLAGGVYDVGLLAMAGGGVAGGMIGARLAPQ